MASQTKTLISKGIIPKAAASAILAAVGLAAIAGVAVNHASSPAEGMQFPAQRDSEKQRTRGMNSYQELKEFTDKKRNDPDSDVGLFIQVVGTILIQPDIENEPVKAQPEAIAAFAMRSRDDAKTVVEIMQMEYSTFRTSAEDQESTQITVGQIIPKIQELLKDFQQQRAAELLKFFEGLPTTRATCRGKQLDELVYYSFMAEQIVILMDQSVKPTEESNSASHQDSEKAQYLITVYLALETALHEMVQKKAEIYGKFPPKKPNDPIHKESEEYFMSIIKQVQMDLERMGHTVPANVHDVSTRPHVSLTIEDDGSSDLEFADD